MSDMRPHGLRNLFNGLIDRWRESRGTRSRVSELACCGEYEIARMARDLAMPVSEFRKIVDKGPEAADLLVRRMAELNLDKDEIAAISPGAVQDLQRLCTLCESHRQCARDLVNDPAGTAWEDYCPNVAMLKLFDALPWAARVE